MKSQHASLIWCLAGATICGAAAAADPAFYLTGNPTGYFSVVEGLSHDGRIAAGDTQSSASQLGNAFRWAAGGSRVDMAGLAVQVTDLSDDGRVMVGTYLENFHGRAVRAFADGTRENLPVFGTYLSTRATGANRDGSIVVGYGYSQGSQDAIAGPWRWQAGVGMQSLGAFPDTGSSFNEAFGISNDGTRIAGTANEGDIFGARRAWVWQAGVGYQILRGPAGAVIEADAKAISGDGRVVAGMGVGNEPCRWVDGIYEPLMGRLSDYRDYEIADISEDGSVIVGVASSSTTERTPGCFVWTPATGIVDLRSYLVSNGVPFPNTFRADLPTVSGDGLTFGGIAQLIVLGGPPSQGFVAVIPGVPVSTTLCVVALAGFQRRRRGE